MEERDRERMKTKGDERTMKGEGRREKEGWKSRLDEGEGMTDNLRRR